MLLNTNGEMDETIERSDEINKFESRFELDGKQGYMSAKQFYKALKRF